jgi:WhiB family redox-sensing transcriptional regulator
MVEFEFPRDALCRALGLDTELFFPVGREGSPGFERSAATARAVCARCPVAAGCLGYALDRGLDSGIYGGLTPDERRALRVPLRLWLAQRAADERAA